MRKDYEGGLSVGLVPIPMAIGVGGGKPLPYKA